MAYITEGRVIRLVWKEENELKKEEEEEEETTDFRPRMNSNIILSITLVFLTPN